MMRARSTRPIPLHLWATLPRSPGCYCIWSPSGVPLYVGRGSDIKARLCQRARDGWVLSGRPAKDTPNAKRAPEGARLSCWVVPTSEESKRLELLLIGVLDPAHNRKPNATSRQVLRVLQGGTP